MKKSINQMIFLNAFGCEIVLIISMLSPSTSECLLPIFGSLILLNLPYERVRVPQGEFSVVYNNFHYYRLLKTYLEGRELFRMFEF